MERLESMPVTRIRRSCRKPISMFLRRKIEDCPTATDGRKVYRIVSAVLALAALAASPLAAGEKVFRYAFNVAETGFDPHPVTDLYSSTVVANIFDPPLQYDYLARPSKLIPNTLESMPEVLEDGTLYRLRVQPGIFFADDPAFCGKPRELTAEHYANSIKLVFEPRRNSPNQYLLEGSIVGMDEVLAKARRGNRLDYETPVEGLRALDRYTHQVRLKQPN